MNKEQELVINTADAIIKILSLKGILPIWQGILEEVRAGMEEVITENNDRLNRDAESEQATQKDLVQWLHR